jgi:hypothetical protein
MVLHLTRIRSFLVSQAEQLMGEAFLMDLEADKLEREAKDKLSHHDPSTSLYETMKGYIYQNILDLRIKAREAREKAQRL